MDSAEDVLGALKAGKTPSRPLGLNCSTETSNSSSFWRGAAGGPEHSEGRISYCHENAQSEILRFAQNDTRDALFRSLLTRASSGPKENRAAW
jgi:hypothetical protein